jgi:hypothetical protein
VDIYNGSLALFGDGNIDNGMVVLFSSRDARSDDVDDVSLRLECSRSGLTRVYRLVKIVDALTWYTLNIGGLTW